MPLLPLCVCCMICAFCCGIYFVSARCIFVVHFFLLYARRCSHIDHTLLFRVKSKGTCNVANARRTHLPQLTSSATAKQLAARNSAGASIANSKHINSSLKYQEEGGRRSYDLVAYFYLRAPSSKQLTKQKLHCCCCTRSSRTHGRVCTAVYIRTCVFCRAHTILFGVCLLGGSLPISAISQSTSFST